MTKVLKIFISVLLAAVLAVGCTEVEQQPEKPDNIPDNTVSAPDESLPEVPSVTSEPITTPPETSTEPPVTEPPEPEFYSVHLVCAGDNLIHSSLYKQAKRRAKKNGDEDGYDFSYVYERVEHYIKDADLAILNQETVVTDLFEPSTYPRFCSPTDLGKHMIDIGFDVFSLSNNHILDKGEEGLLSTLDFWDSQEGIVRYGAYRNAEDMQNIRTLEVNGITFAFLGYMEHTNGLSLKSDSQCELVYLKELELIEQQIKLADTLADVVIVSPHFGKEISNVVTDNQRSLAKMFIDWGADLIIGTQPHTAQEMAYIEREDGTKGFCYYCLGNFVSAQDNPKAMVGIIGDLTVTKNSLTGEISFDNVKAIPIITQYGGNFDQVHIVPYAEYTEKELRSHGCPDFSQSSIDKVLGYIPEEFLAIE